MLLPIDKKITWLNSHCDLKMKNTSQSLLLLNYFISGFYMELKKPKKQCQKPVVMKTVEWEEAALLQQVSAGYKRDFEDASYQRLQKNSKHPRVSIWLLKSKYGMS